MSRYRRRITINVSGEIFETFEKTLKRFPNTLLGDVAKRRPYYSRTSGQYYFDRNKQSFESILYFYQSYGTLILPLGMKAELFADECNFFQIPDDFIYKMKMKAGVVPGLDICDHLVAVSKRAGLWNVLENPRSSNIAGVYIIFSITTIIISIILDILESVRSITTSKVTEYHIQLAGLLLNIWFFIEILARIISSPSKKIFFLDWFNWMDILAVVPFLILFAANQMVRSLRFLRILRIVRVFRLFRLSKQSRRLKVIWQIVKSSLGEFNLLLLTLFTLVVLAGSIMYEIERKTNPEFESIPDALWWGIITVLTVGYGDMTPRSVEGKILTGFVMFFGVITMSMPVLTIVQKFERFYKNNGLSTNQVKSSDAETKVQRVKIQSDSNSLLSYVDWGKLIPNNFLIKLSDIFSCTTMRDKEPESANQNSKFIFVREIDVDAKKDDRLPILDWLASTGSNCDIKSTDSTTTTLTPLSTITPDKLQGIG